MGKQKVNERSINAAMANYNHECFVREPTELLLAGDCKYFDTDVELLHDDDSVRHMLQGLSARIHMFDVKDNKNMLPARWQTKSPLADQFSQKVIAYQRH